MSNLCHSYQQKNLTKSALFRRSGSFCMVLYTVYLKIRIVDRNGNCFSEYAQVTTCIAFLPSLGFRVGVLELSWQLNHRPQLGWKHRTAPFLPSLDRVFKTI